MKHHEDMFYVVKMSHGNQEICVTVSLKADNFYFCCDLNTEDFQNCSIGRLIGESVKKCKNHILNTGTLLHYLVKH